MKILLFGGQGSQSPDMFKAFPEAEVYKTAKEIFGFDVVEKYSAMSLEELALTENAQPAILAYQLAALETYNREHGGEYGAVGGHSLGEYAAAVAASVLTAADAFRLIKIRSRAMSETAAKMRKDGNSGVMCAVIMKPTHNINTLPENISALAANYNSPDQLVLSGSETEIAAAEIALKSVDTVKRAVRLNTGGAFHTRYMSGAADIFAAQAEGIQFNAPTLDFYSNVTGGKINTNGDTQLNVAYFAKHITSPVRFVQEITQAIADGYTEFDEITPKETLTAFVKKIAK